MFWNTWNARKKGGKNENLPRTKHELMQQKHLLRLYFIFSSKIYSQKGRRYGKKDNSEITCIRVATVSRQSRHFFTRGEQTEQQATCPQGLNKMSRFASEHIRHSSNVVLSSPS